MDTTTTGALEIGPLATAVDRLGEACTRTSLLALDALLDAVPGGTTGFAPAARQAAALARHVLDATQDFSASMGRIG